MKITITREKKTAKRREYSKLVTTPLVAVFSALAVGFVVFVCYEMHRLGDLTPVAYMAGPIAGIPAAIVAFYMWRAKAKSKTDLEWEQTRQLTLFREKHPEAFIRGAAPGEEDEIMGGEG